MPDLRSVLGNASVYRFFAALVGARGGRSRFVERYVRPHAGDRILDIGCGPAEILGNLGNVEYTGVDASEKYIADAKRRWNGRGEFTCAGVSEHTLKGRRFDIVLAVGVLHHLDDVEALELFKTAFEALEAGGRLVTIDGVYVKGQSALVRFILSRDRGNYVRDAAGYEGLARSTFASVKADISSDLLAPMPYTHLVMECTK